MRKKLGLALGAGGSRGVAHIGFLQALEEAGLHADCVVGSSMGAVVGSLYCLGVPLSELKERALALKITQLAALNPTPVTGGGILRFSKARRLLAEYLGERTFGELATPFACVATDLSAGKPVLFREGVVVDAVIASSSIPAIIKPARIGGKMYVDGGITERVPTPYLRDMGAEIVVAVDVLGDLMEKKSTGRTLDNLLRCIDIMDGLVTAKKREDRRSDVDLWLEPELGNMDQYKAKKLQFAYDRGYALGKKYAPRIGALLGE